MQYIEFDWYPEPIVVANEYYQAAAELENLSVPLSLSLPEVIAATGRHFADEGPGWQDWAESYVNFAEAHNEGILHQEGTLLEGATSPESYDVLDDSIVWTGAAAPETWIWHEEGRPNRRRGGTLPARPFIGLDEQAEVAIEAIFLAWLDSIIAGMGTLKGLSGVAVPAGSRVANVGVSGFRFRGSGGRFK